MKDATYIHIPLPAETYELLSIRAKAHKNSKVREAETILTRSLIQPTKKRSGLEPRPNQERERDEEAEKRNLPPTPPIKSKGEEEEKGKESPPPQRVRARVRERTVVVSR